MEINFLIMEILFVAVPVSQQRSARSSSNVSIIFKNNLVTMEIIKNISCLVEAKFQEKKESMAVICWNFAINHLEYETSLLLLLKIRGRTNGIQWYVLQFYLLIYLILAARDSQRRACCWGPVCRRYPLPEVAEAFQVSEWVLPFLHEE